MLACSIATLVFGTNARAANEWTGLGGNALWANAANWFDNVVPGNTTGADLADAASFGTTIVNGRGSSSNPIIIDPHRTIRWLQFAGASDNYFIGTQTGNTLNLTTGGFVSMAALTKTVTATINAPISILGANAAFRFTNDSSTASGGSAGTLVFGGPISGGTAGNTVLTLNGINTNANTVNGVISNGQATTLSVTKGDTGTWALTGVNTYSGATTVDRGTLRVNSSAALGDESATNQLILRSATLEAVGVVSMAATRSVNLQSLSSTINTGLYNVTIAGAVSGGGGLVKTGAGTLTLAGTHNYTGATTINQGVLSISSLNSGTNFVFGGGTLRYTGETAASARSFTINAATTATIDVSDAATNLTLNAASAATTGGLTKTGTGTLTIASTQAYTGATEVRGGTLVVALGGGSNIVSTSSRLVLTGGLLRFSGGGSQTFNNVVSSFYSSTRLQVTDAQTLNLGNLTSVSTGQAVVFSLLGGTATLTGRTANAVIDPNWTVQDYNGFALATVNASNQVVKHSTPLLPATGASASTHYRIDNNNGTATTAGSKILTPTTSLSALSVTVDATTANGQMNLNSGIQISTDLWNFGSVGSAAWYVIGTTSGAGIRPLTSGGSIQFNNWMGNGSRAVIFTPILDRGTSSAIFAGTGTTTLSAANTYQGSTSVYGGTLEVTSGGSIASTTNGFIVGFGAGNNATFNLTGGSVTSSYAEIASAAGSVGTANVSSGTWNSASGGLIIGTSGTGTLNISGGTVSGGPGIVAYERGSSGTVNVTGGTWNTGSNGIYVGSEGNGSVNLGTGGTIDSNFVILGYIGNGNGTVTVTGGTWMMRGGGFAIGNDGSGTFNLSGGLVSTVGNVTIGTLTANGNGTVNVTGGTWTIGPSNSVSVGSTSVFNLGGTGSVSSGPVQISGIANVSGGSWTTNSSFVVTSDGSRGLTLTDGGVVQLGASSTGALRLGYYSNGVGVLNIGTGGVAGTLRAGTIITDLGAGVVNFNHTNDVTFATAITANVSVNKLGSGTTTLAGNNTHTAATTVTAGTLLVSGSITGSAIAVSDTGTLGGTGTIANVTVNGGGSLQGGDGVSASGALSSGGSVSLLDNSTIKLTLGTSGAHSSLVRTGGLWSFDSDQAFSMNFTGDPETGFYNNILSGLAGLEIGLASIATWKLKNPGMVGTFTYDNAGGVDLTISAVPEPGSAMLLALAGLGMIGGRRWRRAGSGSKPIPGG